MAFPPNPALLSIKEVMHRLAIGKAAVYELIEAGTLEAFQHRPNCKYTVTARSVDLYLSRTALSPNYARDLIFKAAASLPPDQRRELAEKLSV